ncbi:MAG: type II secretion system F family protein [Alphaproteobacteria bacterium]|nr:MAG: type II secretion system F family protein [Alphaproteobacteria bacterium]
MESMLPFGLTGLDLFTGVAGLAAFLVVFIALSALTVRDPMRGRLKALQARRDELRAGFVAAGRRTSSIRRKNQTDQIRELFTRLKIMQAEQTKKIEEKLIRAGWRSRDAVVIFAFCKIALPIVFPVLTAIGVFGLDLFDLSAQGKWFAISGSGIIGLMAPDILVRNQTEKRQAAIRKGMPDALDLLVICAEAGLTLDAALARVTRELGPAYPELGDEFHLTAIELGFLQERRQALDNLAFRVDLPGIRSVVTTLVQTERYGTPLASSLRVLSAEFRNERMMKAEEKAARLPAIMTVPLILFIMPCLFIVLMGPAACRISDQFINR